MALGNRQFAGLTMHQNPQLVGEAWERASAMITWLVICDRELETKY